MKNVKLWAAALVVVLSAGCSVVKMSRVSPDWEGTDRHRVKRLLVLTAPYPAGDEKVAQMWSALAARHVDLKRNFIILEKSAEDEAGSPTSLCEGNPFDGVLWLQPEAKQNGAGAEVSVQGRLFRCADGAEMWAVDAAGSWPSQQAKLKETTSQYVQEFGPSVEPYVAPSYQLLQAALDTLPDPVLTEDEQVEKIENVQ